MARPERPTTSPMNRIRMLTSSRQSITSRSVSTRSSRASCGVAGTSSTSCAAKARPIGDDRLHARAAGDGHVVVAGAIADAVAARGRRPRAAPAGCRERLPARRPSARGCPRRRRRAAAPNAQARMISGLPRPATTGSASCAPASASLRISGTGLISLFIGEKPETIVPGSIGNRKRPRGDRLGRGLRARPPATRRAARARRLRSSALNSSIGMAASASTVIQVPIHADGRKKVRSRDGRRSADPGNLQK